VTAFPISEAVLAGTDVWVLPMATQEIPPGTLAFRYIDPWVLAMVRAAMWSTTEPAHVGHRVDKARVSELGIDLLVDGAEQRFHEGFAVEVAFRDAGIALQAAMLRERLVSVGPAQISTYRRTDRGNLGRIAVRVLVRCLPAIAGVTVERLHETRVSDSPLFGYATLVEDPRLDEGTILASRRTGILTVGARPLQSEHRAALETIRSGLADVLAWMGEPAETPTHHEVMWALRRQKGPGWPTILYALRRGTSVRPDARTTP